MVGGGGDFTVHMIFSSISCAGDFGGMSSCINFFFHILKNSWRLLEILRA